MKRPLEKYLKALKAILGELTRKRREKAGNNIHSSNGQWIVTCPTCGTKNRVGGHSTNQKPKCGKCGAHLGVRNNHERSKERRFADILGGQSNKLKKDGWRFSIHQHFCKISNCVSNYLRRNRHLGYVIEGTTNYLQRFFVFLVLTQCLYVLFFAVILILYHLEVGVGTMALVSFGFFCTGILSIMIFLFSGIKARLLTYFSTSVIYIITSSLLFWGFSNTELFTTLFSFLGLWCTWNLLFSIVVLIVGIIRTFLIGIGSDYRIKGSNGSNGDGGKKLS